VSLIELDQVIGTLETGWHEYSIEMLSEKLIGIDGSDWWQLINLIENKPPYWKVRCAEGLDEAGDDRSLNLLSSLLTSNEKELAIIATCAIKDTDFPLGMEFLRPLKVLLSQMNENTETRYKDVERLLQRIDASI